ncbi:MAG: YbaK/EbsC family protein [Thermaerobacter sp.]|nr:YbaK/EbsC family protein [Thermaerobacter sp.]
MQDALLAAGYSNRVVELAESARSAAEAAAAIGCTVGQIAKSLVFRRAYSQRPVLVIASGSNRVAEDRIAQRLGEPLTKADARYVRDATGYAIGGIPPLGHASAMTTFIDADLLSWDTIWAAAGHPEAVFSLTPSQLVEMTGGTVLTVREPS